MSVIHIKELHKSLQGLFKIAPSYANTVVSFSTYSGENLTIEVDSSLIFAYLQDRLPQNTQRETVFWRYGNDAFVDATMSLPICVWTDVLDEIERMKDGNYIDAEVCLKELK